MTIQIREQNPGKNLGDFVGVPRRLYTGDPGFVAPLDMEVRERLDPAKNPFFEHADATFFTAYRDGKPVGRISAQIDHLHQERYKDGCGFFGFFDCVDDSRVGKALVDAAAGYLSARKMRTMRGPFSLSINEETGLLVEGHHEPAMIMMPYARPYQDEVAKAAGLAKYKDLYAWRCRVGEIPPRALRAYEQVQQMPEVRIRSVRKSRMLEDVRVVMDIYNDAWSDNWQFVPLTEAELGKMAADLKLLLVEDLAFIAEVDGEPAAMCVTLPNLAEASRDLGGKLSPLGAAKLLWRLKVRQPRSARLILLGIRKKFRSQRRYGGLSTALYVEIARRGERLGYEWGELGWTAEDNKPVNLGIQAMGGQVYKRYRIYEKPLP